VSPVVPLIVLHRAIFERRQQLSIRGVKLDTHLRTRNGVLIVFSFLQQMFDAGRGEV